MGCAGLSEVPGWPWHNALASIRAESYNHGGLNNCACFPVTYQPFQTSIYHTRFVVVNFRLVRF